MYESTTLAERIKYYAKSKKITLKTLFENCGLGRNTMAHLTSGKSIAHDSLAKIADYLDCSVDYLLGRTNNPSVSPPLPDSPSGHLIPMAAHGDDATTPEEWAKVRQDMEEL